MRLFSTLRILEGAPQPCYVCMAATTTQEQLTNVIFQLPPRLSFQEGGRGRLNGMKTNETKKEK